MSSIKGLAGQTLWYGVSSIAARMLNYLMAPYLIAVLTGAGYGQQSTVYAAISFLNVIFTYGLETTFFRYAQKQKNQLELYNTLLVSLIITTFFLSAAMIAWAGPIAELLRVGGHPEYIKWSTYMIALDTLCTMPFAKLRLEGRPIKYAFIRVSGILVNIALLFFFYSVCPSLEARGGTSPLLIFYSPTMGLGYVFIANLVQNILQFGLLIPELSTFRPRFNGALWRELMIYSLPITIVGLGGMINETFDRIMLGWWVHAPTKEAADFQVGIYSANYKLSLLITLFIQAFRLGAEPFFFKQSRGENPQRVYARVMKFFVLTITLMFLFVALYMDIWKYFITRHSMWVGLKVVPILLFANMFLGIYYNLSIWYKLSDKTLSGAYITLIGAAITLVINYAFIPAYGYMACAWATCICYGSMMVLSYVWGQKAYPVPYAWKKLLAYMAIVLALYFVHEGIVYFFPSRWISILTGTILFAGYFAFILRVERREFSRLPYLDKIPILRDLVALPAQRPAA
jgi:O-antigen/teichoic acid export membrane protein